MKVEHKILIRDIPDDFVRCAECDRPLKQITMTHLKRHGLSMSLYIKRHPDSPLRNAKLLLEQSKYMKEQFKNNQKRKEKFISSSPMTSPFKSKRNRKYAFTNEAIRKNVETLKLLRKKSPDVAQHYKNAQMITAEKNRYPTDILIKEYIDIKERIGHTPTGLEFGRHSNISVQTYAERWGSFNNFILYMGDYPKKCYGTELSEVITDVVRVWNNLGRQPTTEEYTEFGFYHYTILKNVFKMGWTELMVSLGGKDGKSHDALNRIPDNILEEEYVSIRTSIGRPLTEEDIRNNSRFNFSVYQRRFGSLGKTREHYERKYFDKTFDNDTFYRNLLSETISHSKTMQKHTVEG